MTSSPCFFSRLTSLYAASGLALGMTVSGAALSSCELDRRPIYGASDGGGGMVTDGGGGMGGDGGIGGDGGMGGGLVAGSQYIPAITRPNDGLVLPPTWAFMSWQSGAQPSGRILQGYELCRTNGPLAEIDDALECPNSQIFSDAFFLLDPLAEDSDYRWKIRARYDGGYFSEWSAVRLFSSDHSLLARLRLNGNALDESSAGNDGLLQNGAGFSTGLDGQALQCDGVDDYADFGAGLNLAGPLTVSAWIFGNGLPSSSDSGILNNGALNYALTYHTDGRIYFYINNGANSLNVSVSPGSWHHAVGTFDGTTGVGGMRLYLDGVLAGMKASTSATTGATGPLWLGRYNDSYLNGRIDQVTVYDSALSLETQRNEYCATLASAGMPPPATECLE